MKVEELNDTQLDFWVAKAEDIEVKYTVAGEYWRVMGELNEIQWLPHRDWAQAGPIIEREGIGFYKIADAQSPEDSDEPWVAADAHRTCTQRGSTPLIAAMRVHVARSFGEDLPGT
jgi:hypothetical protein